MTAVFIRLFAVSLMVGLGVLARKRGLVDSQTTTRMAHVITQLFYPALIYSSLVSTFTLTGLRDNWALPAGSVMIMAVGWLIGTGVLLLTSRGSSARRRAFLFQCTINNYVFLPMPLVLIYWGDTGVGRLVLTSVGSELSVWTMGVMALTGARFHWRSLSHLLSMPMAAIAAAVLTLALRPLVGPALSSCAIANEAMESALSVLTIFGRGTVPLAMLVAGSRMAELKLARLASATQGAVALLRLVVIPAAAIGMLYLLPFPQESRQVLVVVAVMPSAIASVVLSDIYQADREFAATAVLLTHIAALVAVPIWLGILL